ncbi:MAG: 4-hydroxyphenylacetate decarboxylase large subunit [Candidatus Bathyarchaeia archaeon]|jgi:4-hydroxyphenylacetate decarboxylase large subunit
MLEETKQKETHERLAESKVSRGLKLSFQYGKQASEQIGSRETKKQPTLRARNIRDRYLQTKSSASVEFPYWYTRRWNELEGEIPLVRRAKALSYAYSHLTPSIFQGELLVMERTVYLRGSFPMPWLSQTYLIETEKRYEEAKKRGLAAEEVVKVAKGGGNVTIATGNVIPIAGKFGLRKEEFPILKEISTMWDDKSVEDVSHQYEQLVQGYDEKEAIMRSLVCMYDSGYTLPQGREVISYYYPLQFGIDGIIEICRKKMAEVGGDPGNDGINGMDRLYFYKAATIILEGIKKWILNFADEAQRLARTEKDPEQRREYEEIRDILKWVSSKPPRTFREALQLCWTFHIAVLNEDNFSGLAPGRLGQVLYPWWKEDVDAGRIDQDRTMELLECMRMKFTEIDLFGPKSVIEGIQSGSTFNNVSLGGLTKDGQSAANELEMLMIESGITCETPQPTFTLLYDEVLPEEFLMKAIECNKTGTGYPAWVNNRIATEFLLKNFGPEGMTLEEARAVAIGGCLQTSACTWVDLELNGKKYTIPRGGAAPATDVGVHFLNLPKILELVLFDGVDQRTGRRVLPPHGYKLETYEEVWDAYKAYFRRIMDVLIRCNNVQHDIWRKLTPPLVNSILKPDCLDKGMHIGMLGSRYNRTFSVNICGGMNLVNSLASLKKNVYTDKSMTLDHLKEALRSNFGYKTAEEVGSYSLLEQERISQEWNETHYRCLNAPKYGNDDAFADEILKTFEQFYCSVPHEYKSLYGKPLYALQLSVSTHGPMGAAAIATPDGRLHGTTYADASLSAYPGTDLNGPYALFNSATCFDHSESQCTQMNLKVHPSAIRGREGARKLLELIRGYMRKGGFHIQFNVVDTRMLREAQAHPENYRDLLVRVAGFTHYWVELPKPIQDEIIARTEYEELM